MSLNDTASADRLHIGFFGLRNAGKSSVVNAVTSQKLSLVSEVKGTTTDPVQKAMELLPIGPVVIIDTPGIDDEGTLGEMRVKRALEVLAKTDIALLVVDAVKGLTNTDTEMTALFAKNNIPFITVYNKCDLLASLPESGENEIYVSAEKGTNINELRELIGKVGKSEVNEKRIIADLISPGDNVVLVTPIDAAAPKGRMILPQQQTIRDILDAGAICTVTREFELERTLSSLKAPPRIVVTDSQAFGFVNKIVPEDVPLTSFSILFARYKGDLAEAVKGAAVLDRLRDGDRVLISEGCTHHRQCGDIGTQKLPSWVKKHTGKSIEFEFTSGTEFPFELDAERLSLIIHCGGCMLNEREMQSRISRAKSAGIPITNYGVAIAHMHGILKRSIEPFPEISRLLEK